MSDRRQNVYQVPRRFGLRTILVVVAIFAALLSLHQWSQTSPLVLIFGCSFVVVVGAAQVVFERTPRLASLLAGALFPAILKLIALVVQGGLDEINVGLFGGLFSEGKFIFLVVFGAFYGYLIGTLLAGLYLVVDKVQFAARWRFKPRRLPTEASS